MIEKLHELDANKTGLALAIASGIAYIVCVLFFLIAPQSTLTFFSYMFHGIDITKIASSPVPLSNTLIGLVELVILAYLTGALFAWVYNRVIKK